MFCSPSGFSNIIDVPVLVVGVHGVVEVVGARIVAIP